MTAQAMDVPVGEYGCSQVGTNGPAPLSSVVVGIWDIGNMVDGYIA